MADVRGRLGLVGSGPTAFVETSRLAALRHTLGCRIDIIRREVAAAAPLGEAAGCPIIFAACNAMLRVINYGMPVRLRDEPTRSQATMPRLNIGHGDHVIIDAVTALLESEDPMPTTERTDACAFGCQSFNCHHFADRRLTDGTSHHI